MNDRGIHRVLLAATLARRNPTRAAWHAAGAAELIRQHARTLDRWNETLCNTEPTPRQRKKAEKACEEVARIAREWGAAVYVAQDPRGPAVRLWWPDMLPADARDPEMFTDRMHAVDVD